MEVTENRSYNFNGSYTFAYEYINKSGDGSDGRSDRIYWTISNCVRKNNVTGS